ncbi:MAG: hypothetical protein ABIS20_15015 [Thermoanaerobaculia bacterium]
MSKNHWFLVLGMIGLGLAAPAPGLATSHDSALGASGEVYQVKAGKYGDLFPGGQGTAPGTPVLAIDVARPGAALQRVLIPDTLDSSAESSASLLYEDDSRTVYVVWESQEGIHPVLRLAGFDGTTWSTPISVVGNPFAPKTSPQFAITRESFEDAGDDDSRVVKHRNTLHLIWQEEGAAPGALETFYTPVVFVDGIYTGTNPIYSLSDFLPDGAAGDVQPALLRSPTIQAGQDQRTVVVAFASLAKGRLATVEIDVLPEELSRLSEKARSHIIEIGRNLYPTDLPGLAEKARSHIIEIGVAFHPELASTLADQVRATILANDASDLVHLAEKARSHIIEIGAKLSGRGLRNPKEQANTQIVQVDDPVDVSRAVAPTPKPMEAAAYLIQVRVASSRPVPRVGPGSVALFVSEAGDDVLVSWAQVDKVLYRLSTDSSWTEPRELRFTPSLDIDKAYDILGQRVRNR